MMKRKINIGRIAHYLILCFFLITLTIETSFTFLEQRVIFDIKLYKQDVILSNSKIDETNEVIRETATTSLKRVMKAFNDSVPKHIQKPLLDSLKSIAIDHCADFHHLLATVYVESLFGNGARNPKTNASGLIQIMPKTLNKWGITSAQFRELSHLEQIPYIRRHFKSVIYRHDKPICLPNNEDIYLSVFYPAAALDGRNIIAALDDAARKKILPCTHKDAIAGKCANAQDLKLAKQKSRQTWKFKRLQKKVVEQNRVNDYDNDNVITRWDIKYKLKNKILINVQKE